MNTIDQIQKTTLLRAPQEVVWQAISDSREFGTWFGAHIEGPFEAGATLKARIAPTAVDPQIAAAQAPYAGTEFELFVERVEAPGHLSFRWHPGSEPPDAAEPTTLVVFELQPEDGMTRLTITESGFSQLSLERRAKAFADNEGGWTAQLGLIEKYLQKQAA